MKSRDEELLRVLFSEHFALAEKFEQAAQQVANTVSNLTGTETQLGIASLLLDAAAECRSAAASLKRIDLKVVDEQVSLLLEKVEDIPSVLIAAAQEIEFKNTLEDSFSTSLLAAVKEARAQALNEGAKISLQVLSEALKSTILQVEQDMYGPKSTANLRFTVGELRKNNEKLIHEITKERCLAEEYRKKFIEAQEISNTKILKYCLASVVIGIFTGILSSSYYIFTQFWQS